MNGDTYADLFICATNGGNVTFVYRGTSFGLTGMPVTRSALQSVNGVMQSATGDFNGDGFGDVASIKESGVIFYHGAELDFTSSLAENVLTRDTIPGITNIGYAVDVAGVGDFDRDGYADIGVAWISDRSTSPNCTKNVIVLYGSPLGLRGEGALVLRDSMASPCSPRRHIIVAGAGDVDGDGYSDIITGNADASRALLYRGSMRGGSGSPSIPLPGPTMTAQYGYAVAGVGDINGDGYADVAVGAPGENRVYIYTGSASGLNPMPASTLTASMNRFGSIIAR